MSDTKKKRVVILSCLFVLILIGLVFFVPHLTHADVGLKDAIIGSIAEVVRQVAAWLMYIILAFLAALTKLAGWLLDEAFKYSVIYMASNIEKISTIGVGWRTIRDFANLLFIFFLLFIAIETILQVESANVKRTLVRVIIAALLINFSMFFTKALIDFSNILTIGFYNKIAICYDAQHHALDSCAIAHTSSSLSDRFMQVLKLQTIFESPDRAQEVIYSWTTSFGRFAAMSIGVVSVLFVSAFSFFAIAFLMIYRYAIVIMLFILSPLAFAAYGLPQLRDASGRWWNALLGQAVFPILYLIIMLISVLILTDTGFLSPPGATSGQINQSYQTAFSQLGASQTSLQGERDFVKSGKGTIDILVSFGVTIIFMNVALLVAKQYASKAGPGASRLMNWGLGKIETARSKGVAMGRGATIGAAGYVLREGLPGVRKLPDKVFGKIPVVGKPLKVLTRPLSGLGETSRRIEKYLSNTGMGNSRMGRWLRSGTTTAVANYKWGTGMSARDAKKYRDEIEKKKREIDEENKFTDAVGILEGKEYERFKNVDPATLKTEADKDMHKAYLAAQKTVSDFVNEKASSDQIERMDMKLLKNPHLLQHLDHGQWNKIMNGTEKDDKEKAELREARLGTLKSLAQKASVAGAFEEQKMLGNLVRNVDDRELAALADEGLHRSPKKEGPDKGEPDAKAYYTAGLVRLLSQEKLRRLENENLPAEVRYHIGDIIKQLEATEGHKAAGYVSGRGKTSWQRKVPGQTAAQTQPATSAPTPAGTPSAGSTGPQNYTI